MKIQSWTYSSTTDKWNTDPIEVPSNADKDFLQESLIKSLVSFLKVDEDENEYFFRSDKHLEKLYSIMVNAAKDVVFVDENTNNIIDSSFTEQELYKAAQVALTFYKMSINIKPVEELILI